MSHRDLDEKKVSKLERALRHAGAPNASIDLIAWLKDRGHASTTGEAKRLLVDGAVKYEGEPVGRLSDGDDGFLPWKLVPASYREGLSFDG